MFTRRDPDRPIVRRYLGFLTGIFLLFAVQPGSGAGVPRLRTIRFSGASTVQTSLLRPALPISEGVALSDSIVRLTLSSILSLYAQRGYHSATVRPSVEGYSADSASAELVLAIEEGRPTIIRKVSFRGNEALSVTTLSELFPTEEGDIADVVIIEEGISSILSAYDMAGYPYARLSVAEIEAGDQGAAWPEAEITLEIDEGPRTEISEFRLRGNTDTNDDVILRESRMELPALYDPAKISRFTERLRRLGLFSSVKDPELYRSGGVDGLLVSVTEGGQNSFDGVVGYLPPPPGSNDGRVTGLVKVAMRNLFGTGRKMEVEWSRDGRSTQQIHLAYSEPWVFGLPVNLTGNFSQRQQDSSYVDRSANLEAEFLVSGSLSVSGVAGQKQIIPSDRPTTSGLMNSTTTTAGIALRYDTRDDRSLPTRGAVYQSEYRGGRKKVAGSKGGRSVSRLHLDLDVYLSVRRWQVLNIGIHGRQITTGDPEQGDLYRLGGVRSLRGFRENSLAGTRIAWGTVEYRLLSGGGTFFFAFVDPGYVYTPLTDPTEFVTFGYGVGVRLETALGKVGVSFALGKGDPVSETKIHFALINDF